MESGNYFDETISLTETDIHYLDSYVQKKQHDDVYNLNSLHYAGKKVMTHTDVDIGELETLCVGRIRLLMWCSTLNYAHRTDVIYNQNNNEFITKLTHHGMQDHVRDNYTHLLFRLAFSSTPELQKWFVQKECALWRIKYCKSSSAQQKEFLHYVSKELDDKNYQQYTELSLEDMQHADLLGRHPIPMLSEYSATQKWVPYHKVPFVDALYLIQQKRVYLTAGFALVPNYLFYLTVENKYRQYLQIKISKLAKLKLLDTSENPRDYRLQQELSKLKHIINGVVLRKIAYPRLLQRTNKPSSSLPPITADSVHQRSKAFPLCMLVVFGELRRKRHLKDGGRFQLSLFLKRLGLSRSEALKFWRRSDPKLNCNVYINYHYDRNYNAASCIKLRTCHVNSGDCNGCPFKQLEEENTTLIQTIRSFHPHLQQQDIEDSIMQIAKEKHVERCNKLLEVLTDEKTKVMLTRPVDYFNHAAKFSNNKKHINLNYEQ